MRLLLKWDGMGWDGMGCCVKQYDMMGLNDMEWYGIGWERVG